MGLLTGASAYAPRSTTRQQSYTAPQTPTTTTPTTTGQSTNPYPSSPWPGDPTLSGALAGLQGQSAALGQEGYYTGQLTDLQNQGYQQQNALSNQLLGNSNNYLNQQLGFAPTDAGLARQLLGYDRADFNRDIATNRFNTNSDYTRRGAWGSIGQNFRLAQLAGQEQTGNQRFDTRGTQVDQNLAEELARIRNSLAGNNLQLSGNNSQLANQLATNTLQGAQQQASLKAQMQQLALSAGPLNQQLATEIGLWLQSHPYAPDPTQPGYQTPNQFQQMILAALGSLQPSPPSGSGGRMGVI